MVGSFVRSRDHKGYSVDLVPMDELTKQEKQEQARSRLRAIDEEQVVRMRNNKYLYYEPNAVIEDFINAFGSDDYFIIFLSAANGVGKTAAAAAMLGNLMYPNDQNQWFRGGLFDDFPYLKRGRIVTDSALVDKNLINELKFWLPKGRYQTQKAAKHYESQWVTDTGWSFDIMTYNQDVEEFEGVTLGWAWFDEPPPYKILQATIARMRRGGIIFITATPISGSAHLYDLFAKGELEVEVVLREGEEPIKVQRSVYHVTADVESACKEHGIRGHLNHDDIVKMTAEYPEDERQARIYGKFQHLIGLVFKRFSRDIHVVPDFNVKDTEFIVYEYLDPHPRNPDAVLWFGVDRKGNKYVVDELYYTPSDVKDLAAKIKNKASQYRIGGRWIDPWAFNKDNHMGEHDRNLADQLADEGLTYLAAPKQRTAADKRIQTALNYHQINGFMKTPPELFIMEHCKRTQWEFEHYRWDEWEGKTGEKRDRKEKPVDKDDHMIENLGRALIMEHTFIEKPKQRTTGGMSRKDFDPYA